MKQNDQNSWKKLKGFEKTKKHIAKNWVKKVGLNANHPGKSGTIEIN